MSIAGPQPSPHFSSALLRVLCGLLFCLAPFVITGCAERHFQPKPGLNYSLGMLHKIEKHDTIHSLARYYQRDPAVLVVLNGLRPPYNLPRDQYLYIPPDNSTDIVRSGRLSLTDIHRAIIAEINRARQVPHKEAVTLKTEAKSASRRIIDSVGETVSETGHITSEKMKKTVAALKPGSQGKSSSARRTVTVAPKPGRALSFSWPVEGRYVRGFSTSNWRKPHKGVDIAAQRGEPVLAAQDGVVLFAGTMGTYGKMVVLDHGPMAGPAYEGFSTIYAHNSKILTSQGKKVRRGQPLALVGSTGRSTGNHVHLELRYNGVAVDPEKYFPKFISSD